MNESVHGQGWCEIAFKASTLFERINLPSGSQVYSPGHVEQILARWTKTVSQGDRATFLRRLSWDDLTEDQVKQALSGAPDLSEGLPDWIETLEAVLDRCPDVLEDVQKLRCPEHALLTDGVQIIFPELWLPFLRLARKRLLEQAGPASALIAENALNTLQRQLLVEMSALGELAAYRQFVAFRNARLFCPRQVSENSYHVYRSFVTMLLEKRLMPLFQEYAVLARQLCRIVDAWVGVGSELLLRLSNDSPVIAQEFSRRCEPGQVTELRPALSDRHHGGRRVVMLAFSSGLKLIYKPRNVEQEYAYNQLLAWLERESIQEALPSLKVLECDGYGWVEYVAQSPCQSEEEVERYYRQAGMLACLIYVLGGNDFHMDNLVATRKGPVLIDVESLVQQHPATRQIDGTLGAFAPGKEGPDSSVLSTGLLDFAVRAGPDGRISDASGLRGMGGYDHYNKKRVWRYANTDAMRLEYERTQAESMQNMVLFKGQVQYPEDHAEALVDGFARAYRFILSHRESLLAEGSPLNLFADTPVRIIHRPSNDYAIFLYGLATPKYQRNGLDKSIVFEYLTRIFLHSDRRPDLWHLLAREQQALEDLDIPHFAVPASFDSLVERLSNLNESDLERQAGLIHAALNVFQDDSAHVELAGSRTEMWSGETLPRKALVRQAELIAEQIQAQTVQRDDGAVTWTAPAYLRLEENFERDISYYLYDGACGIALFLAALASVTGNKECEALAAVTSKSITRAVENDYAGQLLEDECLGACNGLGSVVYSLVTIGRILEDDSYLHLVKRMAALITPERISADRRLDVEGGSAGALMALLGLYAVDNNPAVLEQAINCARHLLDYSHVQGDSRGWKNPEGIMLAGFAHGASGIALALFRLYQITGNQIYFKAGEEAFEYERELFSRERRNWPVLRKKGNGKIDASLFMTGWCHGAPGIGLARIGALEVLDDARICTEIDDALGTTAGHGLARFDHLCCGNLGRADILLTAGRILDKPELVKTAQDRMIQVFCRAQKEGYFSMRLKTWENRCFQPGFFKGLSGIGYTLLRMAYPERLPSVLFFDTLI